jgi:hypothetical protein
MNEKSQRRICTLDEFQIGIHLSTGPKAGRALVGHADANSHALLNTRSFLCIQPQALLANRNSQPPRGGPGAMHNGLCSR